MMSPETIASLSRAAVRRSRAAGLLPRVVEEDDLRMTDAGLLGHLRGIPFIGDRNPRGFTPLRDEDGAIVELFCDSSGWGSEDEPALTQRGFLEKVREFGPGHAYAISEAGQFQVYVRVYRTGPSRAH